jgi:putative transposase
VTLSIIFYVQEAWLSFPKHLLYFINLWQNYNMKIKQTIQIIIEADNALKETLQLFTQLKREISPVCFNSGKILGQISLHKHTYSHIKGRLNAQMTCSVIRLVAAAYTSARQNKHSVAKTFNFKKEHALYLVGKKGRDASFKKGKLSIWTIAGRKRLNYSVPDYFKPIFDKATEIDSINVVEKAGNLIGYVCLSVDVPEPKGILPVGVDLNETNILVAVDTDDKELFIPGISHKILNTKTRKTRKRVKAKLTSLKAEKKDTHSVRRLLKRLARKQSNRTNTFCQTVAKQLVNWCPVNTIIVLEDLKIPKVSKDCHQRKGVKRRLSQWARGQVTQFIEYNAAKKGIAIEKVNPYNTSQICSRCGLNGLRLRHNFDCPHCSFHIHSDLNAAVNIRNRFTILRDSGLPSINPETLPPGEGKLPA